MTEQDRVAIENAALVLRAVYERADSNPEFSRHIVNLPVPGGRPIVEFVSAISHVAVRHPTKARITRLGAFAP